MNYTIGSTVLGNWIIKKELGEGSFGKVFEIEKCEYGVTITSALKVIRIPHNESEIESAYSDGMDEVSVTSYFRGFVDDIMREVAVMASVKSHANVVKLEDYTAIEHVEGIGWDILIRMELLTAFPKYQRECQKNSATLSRERVIQLGKELCNALAFCQSKGLIHRDIKPANVFVDEMGQFKLGDFGVARTIERTMGGMSKKGTEEYMAPEVYKGQEYDATVDIYSLGIMMYRLLNQNRLPFHPLPPEPITMAGKMTALEKRMKGETMPMPSDADEALGKVILKACAFQPKERFQSATEMLQALNAVENIKTYIKTDVSVSSVVEDYCSEITISPFGNISESNIDTYDTENTVSPFGNGAYDSSEIYDEQTVSPFGNVHIDNMSSLGLGIDDTESNIPAPDNVILNSEERNRIICILQEYLEKAVDSKAIIFPKKIPQDIMSSLYASMDKSLLNTLDILGYGFTEDIEMHHIFCENFWIFFSDYIGFQNINMIDYKAIKSYRVEGKVLYIGDKISKHSFMIQFETNSRAKNYKLMLDKIIQKELQSKVVSSVKNESEEILDAHKKERNKALAEILKKYTFALQKKTAIPGSWEYSARGIRDLDRLNPVCFKNCEFFETQELIGYSTCLVDKIFFAFTTTHFVYDEYEKNNKYIIEYLDIRKMTVFVGGLRIETKSGKIIELKRDAKNTVLGRLLQSITKVPLLGAFQADASDNYKLDFFTNWLNPCYTTTYSLAPHELPKRDYAHLQTLLSKRKIDMQEALLVFDCTLFGRYKSGIIFTRDSICTDSGEIMKYQNMEYFKNRDSRMFITNKSKTKTIEFSVSANNYQIIAQMIEAIAVK